MCRLRYIYETMFSWLTVVEFAPVCGYSYLQIMMCHCQYYFSFHYLCYSYTVAKLIPVHVLYHCIHVCLQIVLCKYHTVFLAHSGQVYTCGHGQGGRLGHGDELTCVVSRCQL